MKAADVTAAGRTPVYSDFATPTAAAGEELISVRAAALSPLSKALASGSHYSSGGVFPSVAGVDGVGVTQDASLFRLARGALRGSRRVLSHEP